MEDNYEQNIRDEMKKHACLISHDKLRELFSRYNDHLTKARELATLEEKTTALKIEE
jgi:hypothetical protein